MGSCFNCKKEFTLKEEEIKCDNCGEIVNYKCWNCNQWFSILEGEEKLKECKWCGFFVCPNCDSCGMDCDIISHKRKIKKILYTPIAIIPPVVKIEDVNKRIKQIIDYFEEIKLGKEMRCCPHGVPISYGKGRIKRCIVRTMGYRIKSDSDLDAFKKRHDEILNISLGKQLTINQSREDGSYGQEYRDVFNYCICLGKLEKKKIKKQIGENKIEYEVYERCEKNECPMLDLKKLIIKICINPKCKIKEFPLSQTECCYCKYKKGNKKGKSYPLRLKISNKDICQLNRGDFKKEDGEGGDMEEN